MSKFLLLVVAILLGFGSFAQQFGDDGAIWHYRTWDSSSKTNRLLTLTAEKDTIFEGKSCAILKRRGHLADGFLPYKNMICNDSNKVLFWSISKNEFQVLYDFSAKKGDDWTSSFDDYNGNFKSDVYFLVDSVYVKMINNRNIQVQVMRIIEGDASDLNTHKPYYYSIYENIGCTAFIFPWPSTHIGHDGIPDLRCYEDDSIGLYRHDKSVACDYTQVGLEESSTKNQLVLSPNPNKGRFLVANPAGLIAVRVFDVQGKLVFEQRIADSASNELEVDLERQLSGLFFVEVVDKAGEITRQKMVLQQ